MKYVIDATITKREVIIKDHLAVIEVDVGDIAGFIKPFQFLNIKMPYPLRRPFAFYYVDGSSVGILFNVVGRGTKWLYDRVVGDSLDIMLPLGNPFIVDKGSDIGIIAGGSGIAGANFLVEYLSNVSYKIYYGVRGADFIHDRIANKNIIIATEDGSAGFKGLVSDIIDIVHDTYIVAGPIAMIKAVYTQLKGQGISDDRIYIATESRMGCGYGVCLGCAIPKRDGGYLYCCKDGVVFRSDAIDVYNL